MNWTLIQSLSKNNVFAHHEDYLKNAEYLLADEFLFQNVYNMEPSPQKYKLIDWQTSPNGDPEWLFVLKRQEYLQDLVYAYLVTDKIKYLKKAKYYIFAWIKNNYDITSVRYSTWRTIDTGIRLLNWAPTVDLLKKQHLLTAKELKKLGEVVNEQAQYLENHYIEKYDLSNWGVLITTGILTFDAINLRMINEEKVDWAKSKFTIQMRVQVDSEGMHWEQSPLYFVEVFRSALCVYGAYQSARIPLKSEIKKILVKMLQAFEYQILPDGKLLQQGDTDTIPVRDLFNSAWNILKNKNIGKKFDFLTSMFDFHLKATQKSLEARPFFDGFISGNFVNKESKNYLHLFNGNLGSGHGHAANGHVDVTIGGENLLIDPGRYTYVNSSVRRLLKSGSAHNVLLVDDKYPIVPKDSWKFKEVAIPIGNEVRHLKNIDAYKMVTLNAKNEIYRTRYVVWLKDQETMVIIDALRAYGKHRATSNWILGEQINPKQIDSNRVALDGQKSSYNFFTTAGNVLQIDEQVFSPRYNEKKSTTKLSASRDFKDYYINFTVIGKVKNVQKLTVKQAGTEQKVPAERGYAFKISDETNEITFVLQHLNTFVGNKLYYVDEIPTYGELNLIIERKSFRVF